MLSPTFSRTIKKLFLAASVFGLSGCLAGQGGGLLPSSQTTLGTAQNTVQNEGRSLVKCASPVGVAALVEPPSDSLAHLRKFGLSSPIPVLKLLMARSGCFRVVDRGAASEALQRERALAKAGELEKESKMGGGQMVAADFLISPNVLFQDADSGGSNIGATLGALLPGVLGGIAGSLNVTNLEAQILLTLTNVRTGVQEAVAEGSARKADIGFGLGGLLAGGTLGAAAGGGNYASTDIGKIVMAAFVDGHNKLVQQLAAGS